MDLIKINCSMCERACVVSWRRLLKCLQMNEKLNVYEIVHETWMAAANLSHSNGIACRRLMMFGVQCASHECYFWENRKCLPPLYYSYTDSPIFNRNCITHSIMCLCFCVRFSFSIASQMSTQISQQWQN